MTNIQGFPVFKCLGQDGSNEDTNLSDLCIKGTAASEFIQNTSLMLIRCSLIEKVYKLECQLTNVLQAQRVHPCQIEVYKNGKTYVKADLFVVIKFNILSTF